MKSDARGLDDFSIVALLRSAAGGISALLTLGGLIGVELNRYAVGGEALLAGLDSGI